MTKRKTRRSAEVLTAEQRLANARKAQVAYMATQFNFCLPAEMIDRVIKYTTPGLTRTAAVRDALDQWLSVAEQASAEDEPVPAGVPTIDERKS